MIDPLAVVGLLFVVLGVLCIARGVATIRHRRRQARAERELFHRAGVR